MNTDTLMPVEPSIGYLTPSFRQRLISWYAEIADTERGLCRPEWEQHARAQIDRLSSEGDVSLAEMLEAS